MIGYTRHQKTKNLGNIGGQVFAKNKTQGIVMLSSIAISPDGTPLGIVSNYIWSRGEEKESFKWISAIEEYTQKIENKMPCITICDRESNFNRFFQVSDKLDQKIIVRSFRDRNIGDHYVTVKMYKEIKKVNHLILSKLLVSPVKIGRKKTKEVSAPLNTSFNYILFLE